MFNPEHDLKLLSEVKNINNDIDTLKKAVDSITTTSQSSLNSEWNNREYTYGRQSISLSI